MRHPKAIKPSPNWLCKNCGHSYTVDDTPFPPLPEHLVNSNDPPSAQELLDIHDSVPSVQDLANLDKEIESLERVLSLLYTRRAEMKTCSSLRRSILSPSRRVPPEIIADIIWWAVRLGTGGYGKSEGVTLDTKCGLWAYSHVCRLWRSITLDTPSYWTKLSIDIGPYFNGSTATVTKCIKTVLSRSQNHTLSFRFAYAPDNPHARSTALRSLKLLIECAPRWREALFRIPTDFFYSLRPVKNRIPNLESLGLEFRGEPEDDYPRGDYFRTAPALRKLLFGSELVFPEHFQLPWSQITEYRANDVDGYLFTPLKLMPDLLSLELYAQLQEERGHIELTKLRRLKALTSTTAVCSLTLPALQEMIVCAGIEELEPMIYLIERSECRITTLAFQQTQYWEDRANKDLLLDFFKLLPILLVLDLSRDTQFNIIACCSTLMSALDVLPLLTELVLPPIHDCDQVRTVLINFLQQRRSSQSISPTTCAIKRVVFIGEPESLWPEIESLHRDGLQVLFRLAN